MKAQRSYASGFVDALALVTVTLMILFAALVAGGCSHAMRKGDVAQVGRDQRNVAETGDILSPPSLPSLVLIACEIVDLRTGRRAPC